MQENDHGRNEHREEEVEPGAGGKESDEGDEGERDDCDGEVVAGEVEEVPGGGEEEEEEEGEGVAEEGEEEDEEEEEGVVEEEVGQVVGEARGGFRDGGWEAEGGGVKEHAPGAPRRHHALTCFLYV